jgi:predicted DNA-binding transcriptional regulator YafY
MTRYRRDRSQSRKLLERWMALDAALARGELRVDQFAEEWEVSPRQVIRDLAMFKAMGFEMTERPGWVPGSPNGPGRRPRIKGYYPGQKPMFVASLSEEK